MKRILLTLAILGFADLAKAGVDAFYSGVHLGMCIDDCAAYYQRVAGSGPIFWGGAPAGQKTVDFRERTHPKDDDDIILERRVVVTFRTSDGKIVSIGYWNLNGDRFSKNDLKKLLDLNQKHAGQSHLVSHFYDQEQEFVVTTAQEDKLKQDNDRALEERAQRYSQTLRSEKPTPSNP